ncbi:MAG: hypothetical protein ABWZ98_01210 [Nakamurella sp.]
MTILETLAVFVGIPVLIYALIGAFTLIPGRSKRRPKDRPGQQWDYPAQWWAGDQPVVGAGTAEAAGMTGGGASGKW